MYINLQYVVNGFYLLSCPAAGKLAVASCWYLESGNPEAGTALCPIPWLLLIPSLKAGVKDPWFCCRG